MTMKRANTAHGAKVTARSDQFIATLMTTWLHGWPLLVLQLVDDCAFVTFSMHLQLSS